MSELAQAWSQALPEVRNGLTGVGVWTALNSSVPIALEDDTFVLGIPHASSELAGHLKMSATKVLIERAMAEKLGRKVNLRVIEGDSQHDWDNAKRKDEEVRRLQNAALDRARAELEAKSSWETVYEAISRRYAGTQNKSLPQFRAEFFVEGCRIIAEALKVHPPQDDLGERNFARCLERVAHYSEVPSVLVAIKVKELCGT